MNKKYKSFKLMSAVRHGNFREVRELISAYGLSLIVLNGYVLLCIAIKKGHKNIAKLLLRKGVNIKRKTENCSTTPLHLAAKKGYIEIAKKLLDRGAYIDATDEYNYTPLYYAVKNRKAKLVKLLLNRNANFDFTPKDEAYNALHIAAEQGYEEIVKLLINKYSKRDAKIGYATIFHMSTEKEYEKIIQFLRVHYAFCLESLEIDYTPMHFTVECTNAKDARLFLKQNPHKQSNYGVAAVCTSALYCLTEKEATDETIKVLVYTRPGIDIFAIRQNPLHLSTMKGHEMIVKLLLESGADIDITDAEGDTALTIAIEKGYLGIVEEILKHSPDLNSNSNRSVLNTAVSHWLGRYQKSVELLLQYSAIAIPENADNSEVLLALLEKGHVKIFLDLIKHDVDVNVKRRYDNLTPLHTAVEQGHLEIIKLLLDRGANVNATDIDNRTPLHIAVQIDKWYSFEIIELLLNSGADVNAAFYIHKNFPGHQESKESNINGCPKFRTSALHIAAQNDEPRIVDILLEFGADIECRDDYGRTAFHIACKRSIHAVLIFLRYGCDVNIVCNMNKTPLHYAIRQIEEKINGIPGAYRRYYEPMEALFIQQHIIRMKVANLYVSEQNLALIPQEIINNYQNICENEMKIMKRTKIGISNVSFWDILTDNISQLVMYAKNESVVQDFRPNYCNEKFPEYANMIQYHFQKGMKRKKLQEQGEQFFYSSFINFPFKLPCNCVDKILYYLSNNDLRILIDVCKSVRNT